MSNQESTQVEVVAGLSALYFLIEQRRETLPRHLNDELQSIIEDIRHSTINHEPANTYEPSLCSAQTLSLSYVPLFRRRIPSLSLWKTALAVKGRG